MAFTESEIADFIQTIEEEFWVHRRPPLHLREQIREGQRFEDQAIILYFQRPALRRAGEFIEEPIAKLQYIRSRDLWRIFWQRSDLKWHGYKPLPETETLKGSLKVVSEDEKGCFFG